MSSLQKFHRRTNNAPSGPVVTWPPSAIGMGNATYGYWLGTAGDGTSKLIVAPKSTEVTGASSVWGSYGTVRGTTSTTNGLSNTNTLYALGSAAHPAAYYCKTLATGGYNTWYMPAINELYTLYSNKSATPFATSNDAMTTNIYRSSTEINGQYCGDIAFNTGVYRAIDPKTVTWSFGYIRAVRRY
jgi:hypothetical protein